VLIRALEADHDGTPVSRSHARGVALLVATAVQTGLRVDELRHMRAEDISDDAVTVRAHGDWRPKDRAERTVPIPRAAATLARELVAWRDTAKGMRGRPLALGAHWIADRIAAAWTAARLPGEPPGMHDCRRTYATELSRTAGVSVRDVQRLLGHADLSTTERYLSRYRSDASRAAVDLGVSAALAGPPADVVPLRRRAVP
jgi:integrase